MRITHPFSHFRIHSNLTSPHTMTIRELIDANGGTIDTTIIAAKELEDSKTYVIDIKFGNEEYKDEYIPANDEEKKMLFEVEDVHTSDGKGKHITCTMTHDKEQPTALIVISNMVQS